MPFFGTRVGLRKGRFSKTFTSQCWIPVNAHAPNKDVTLFQSLLHFRVDGQKRLKTAKRGRGLRIPIRKESFCPRIVQLSVAPRWREGLHRVNEFDISIHETNARTFYKSPVHVYFILYSSKLALFNAFKL